MDNNSEIERKLVIQLVQGNESAFCELYALYKTRLMYFALQFVKSQEFAEDVFQDAFASVWQNRQFINPNSPFGPYIYTIIKNRILNLLAGMDRDMEFRKTILAVSIDANNDTENAILNAELLTLIGKAMDKLTPQQKRVFEMSRNDTMSHKEIAHELSISIHTVQQHISESLKIIRAYLRKNHDDYVGIILLLFCLNC